MNGERTLDISWTTIFKVFIAIFIFYLLYLTKEIVLWFFFALAISVLLTPAVKFLKKIWIPNILAVALVYFSIFGIIGILIYLMAPIFISELRQLSYNMPDYFVQVSPFLEQIGIDTAENFSSFTQTIVDWLTQSSKGVISAIMTFFGGLYSTLFILVAAFFLSLENNAAEKFLILIAPKRYEDKISLVFRRSQNKISGWFGARILACIFVGIASYIVFYVFGVKYAFILALTSGILNFIPYIGPLLTTILLILFVAVSSSSWLTIIYVLAAIYLIQAVENNILTPILMKRIVDVPPVLVLVSLLIGAQLFGFLGMIFAVPVFGIIFEFLREFLEKKRVGAIEEN